MFGFVAVVLSWITPATDLPGSVQYWQRALDLQDWAIELRIVPRDELDRGTLGDIEPRLETRTAVLRVLRQADSDLPPWRARSDQRLTIAHEMVHLRRFASGDPTWANERATTLATGELLRKHRRRIELRAAE